ALKLDIAGLDEANIYPERDYPGIGFSPGADGVPCCGISGGWIRGRDCVRGGNPRLDQHKCRF
ncbi:hypothetical protein, partial [Neisseria gonorrhoeae]|uniref:hypothetical protein n=1 Tax=Neisseria gonorrhoeae TaxID=485 RepID=UPI001B7FE203